MRKSELGLALVAFLAVVLFGALPGIIVAVGLSLIAFIRRAWRPYDAVLGRVRGYKGYHDVTRHPDALQVPGLTLFRWDAPLFFANAQAFREHVLTVVDALAETPRWFVVAAEPITDVDTTAADMLNELITDLARRGTELHFAELKGPTEGPAGGLRRVRAPGRRPLPPDARQRGQGVPRPVPGRRVARLGRGAVAAGGTRSRCRPRPSRRRGSRRTRAERPTPGVRTADRRRARSALPAGSRRPDRTGRRSRTRTRSSPRGARAGGRRRPADWTRATRRPGTDRAEAHEHEPRDDQRVEAQPLERPGQRPEAPERAGEAAMDHRVAEDHGHGHGRDSASARRGRPAHRASTISHCGPSHRRGGDATRQRTELPVCPIGQSDLPVRSPENEGRPGSSRAILLAS